MSGPSTQTSTARQQQNLSSWALPEAQKAIASYMNFVFPTAQQQAAQQAGAQQNMGTVNQMVNQLDPTGTLSNLFGGIVGGSTYLQNLNPNALYSAMSPAAASQLTNQNIYGGSNPYLSWIPGWSAYGGGGQTGGSQKAG